VVLLEKHNGYFKKIDFVFYNAHKIREAVEEAKFKPIDHNANGSGVGDPTAAQAIHNILPIKYVTVEGKRLEWPEAWLRVYDVTISKCTPIMLGVLRAFYNDENYIKTCDRLGISQPTHSRLKGQFRHIQELCAVQEGLIRVF
jgi:hypothetical protein